MSGLDGCRHVSWPPYLPSHRRDRDRYLAYADCQACGGLGLEKPVSRHDSGGTPCRACTSRHASHPLRVWDRDRRLRIMEVAQAVFARKLDEAAGVPERCPARRREALLQAFVASAGDQDAWNEWKRTHPVAVRARRLLAAHARKAQRLGVSGVWREPQEELDRASAAVRRRRADLQAKTFPVVTGESCSRGCGETAEWLCRDTLLCRRCWQEQEQKPGHRKAGERHPFGSCAECDAWTVARWPWDQVTRYYRDFSLISRDMWEAYRCTRAAQARDATGTSRSGPALPPETAALAAFMRQALTEPEETGREQQPPGPAGPGTEYRKPGLG